MGRKASRKGALMCGRKFIALLLSLSLFGPSFPALSYSEEAPSLTAYESELNRLKVISARLQAISLALDLKLSESEASLQALSNELETLRIELQGLKSQLETSLQGSEALAETLEKSEALLAKLTESFKEYKGAAETKIKRLERWNKALTWIAGLLGLGATVAGTAWAVK